MKRKGEFEGINMDDLTDIAGDLLRECDAEARAMRGEPEPPAPNPHGLSLRDLRLQREHERRLERKNWKEALADDEQARMDYYNKVFGPSPEAMALIRQETSGSRSPTVKEWNREFEAAIPHIVSNWRF